MRTILATLTLISATLLTQAADTPKAIVDSLASLEKALLDSKDPVEKDKLREAITALKKVASPPPKIQNELISDFVDNTANYKGRELCFQLTYTGGANSPLNTRAGDKFGVPFTSKDPKNGAELFLGAEIPQGLKVPAAKHGESVVVTFKCTTGSVGKGNVVVSIARP